MQPCDHQAQKSKFTAADDSDELRFIDLSNNYSGDLNTKKAVRRHVMTKVRRDQRKGIANKPKPKLPKAKELDKILPEVRTLDKLASSQFRCFHVPAQCTRGKDDDEESQQVVSLENETQLARLPTVLGAGRIDPLNSLPIESSPQTAYLIDHFNQFITWRISRLPNSLFANFFRYSLTDSALAHAMMIYSANHDQFSTGRSKIVEIYHHQVEAIRILNSRLRTPKPDTSDETIVTIASLVIFEEMFGSSASADTHRAGLQQLVQLRGGIARLGTPSVSVTFVGQALISPASVRSWENTFARTEPSNPYLTPPAQSPDFLYPQNPTAVPKTTYLSACECSIPHAPYPASTDGWDEIMKETFTRLKDSSSLASSTLHTKHHLSIHNESYLVENRIVKLIQGFETENLDDKNVKVVYGKSWLLGCRLYLYTVLRCSESKPARHDVLRGSVGELRLCLEEEFDGYPEVYSHVGKEVRGVAPKYYSPNVLLWVLLVGGSNAMALAMETWKKQADSKSKIASCQQDSTTLINAGGGRYEIKRVGFEDGDNGDFEWFLAATGQVCFGLGIREWSSVKSRMGELPWVEWKIEGEYRRFWESTFYEGASGIWTVFQGREVYARKDIVILPVLAGLQGAWLGDHLTCTEDWTLDIYHHPETCQVLQHIHRRKIFTSDHVITINNNAKP